VFHGIDSLGWEWTPIPKLDTYFNYIKAKENNLWIATFGDVTKYMRERKEAEINYAFGQGQISVELTHGLKQAFYDLPLTLKTYIPGDWKQAKVVQGDVTQTVGIQHDDQGAFVLYQAKPNTDKILLTQ
jgi:hypothetical protein